jgi:hypothetical protein
VGALVLYHSGSLDVPVVLWATAAGVALLGLLRPSWARPIFLGWMYLLYPVGLVMSLVLTAVVFYGVMMPFGLLLRAFGYDPMGRRFDRAAASYWVAHNPGGDLERYFRQI